jgi:hypothetical protein
MSAAFLNQNYNSWDSSKDLAEELQSFIQSFGDSLTGDLAPMSDASSTIKAGQSDLSTDGIVSGVVRYVMPHTGNCLIATDGYGLRQGYTSCSGGMFGGTKQYTTYPPGTAVRVVLSDYASDVMIVGVEPSPVVDPAAYLFCDQIVQGSGVGYYASAQYRDYAKTLIDRAGGAFREDSRPIDELPGDYAVLSPTGVGMFVDDAMTFLRTSEVCGLFLFREDGHTRLSGESMEIETDAVMTQHGIAVAECYNESISCVYPWEASGLSAPGSTSIRSNPVDAIRQGEEATREPAKIDAIPLPRFEQFGGYLGQGQLLVVSAPQGDGVMTLAEPVSRAGLFREQTLVDGTRITETANQMFWVKSGDIPIIRRTAPRDYLGEDQSYKYNGLSGVGESPEDHEVKQLTGLDTASAAEEVWAYASGWQSLCGAAMNPNVKIDYREGTAAPMTLDLSQSDTVNLPTPERVRIDHRYSEIDIYRVLSLFAFLPNGDVVLQNGLGAELALRQGSVEINATAINMIAAKVISALSKNVAIRGNADVEVVSSQGSLRFKGERDVRIVGGNGGRGGVVIEAKTRGMTSVTDTDPSNALASGIMFKSPNSHISTLGQDIILRTGGSNTDIAQGSIVIDAGSSRLIQKASQHHRYSRSGFFDHFGQSQGSIQRTNAFASGGTYLSGTLSTTGTALIGGSIQAGSHIVSLRGHFASVLAASPRYNYRVGGLKDPGSIESNFANARNYLQGRRQSGVDSLQTIRDRLELSGRPLDPTTIARTQFGFPSSTSYGTSRSQYRQPFWQRRFPSSGAVWQEPTCTYQGSPTRPWPGNETWNRDDSFLVYDAESAGRFLDNEKQMPKSPDVEANRELYAKAELQAFKPASMSQQLKIHS